MVVLVDDDDDENGGGNVEHKSNDEAQAMGTMRSLSARGQGKQPMKSPRCQHTASPSSVAPTSPNATVAAVNAAAATAASSSLSSSSSSSSSSSATPTPTAAPKPFTSHSARLPALPPPPLPYLEGTVGADPPSIPWASAVAYTQERLRAMHQQTLFEAKLNESSDPLPSSGPSGGGGELECGICCESTSLQDGYFCQADPNKSGSSGTAESHFACRRCW